jgi:hypothetical protein
MGNVEANPAKNENNNNRSCIAKFTEDYVAMGKICVASVLVFDGTRYTLTTDINSGVINLYNIKFWWIELNSPEIRIMVRVSHNDQPIQEFSKEECVMKYSDCDLFFSPDCAAAGALSGSFSFLNAKVYTTRDECLLCAASGF